MCISSYLNIDGMGCLFNCWCPCIFFSYILHFHDLCICYAVCFRVMGTGLTLLHWVLNMFYVLELMITLASNIQLQRKWNRWLFIVWYLTCIFPCTFIPQLVESLLNILLYIRWSNIRCHHLILLTVNMNSGIHEHNILFRHGNLFLITNASMVYSTIIVMLDC